MTTSYILEKIILRNSHKMLQKVQILGLIIALTLLELFGAAADYDPGFEYQNPSFEQVLSIRTVDNSFLNSSSEAACLASSTGSAISQPGVTNAATESESVFQPIATNTDTSSTSRSSPPSSSSTSVNFGAPSGNSIPSITNSFSPTDNSVVLAGNSASATGDSVIFTGNSVSAIVNSAPSTLNSASTTGNYISSTGNSVSNNGKYVSPRVNYASSNPKCLSDTTSQKTHLIFNNGNGIPNPSESILPESTENPFSKAVLSIPTIQNLLNVELPGSTAEAILFNMAFKLAIDVGNSYPGDIATIVSKDANSLEVFTIPLYFQLAGNGLTKFLLSEGIDLVPSLYESYAVHIENALKSTDVTNIQSVYQDISNGFVTFLQSLGFNVVEKADVLGQLFNTEIQSLRSG